MTYRERKRPVITKTAWFVAGATAAVFFSSGSCGGPDTNSPAIADGAPEIPATVFIEPCDKLGEDTRWTPGVPIVYASHEFPGLPAGDIAARVTVVGKAPFPIAGFEWANRTAGFIGVDPPSVLLIRDGWVGVLCGYGGKLLNFNSVTFVFR